MGLFTDVPYEIGLLIQPATGLGEQLIGDKLRPIFREVNDIYLEVWLNRMTQRAQNALG